MGVHQNKWCEMKTQNSSGKRRCLCFILCLVLFVICINISITALLLYYINVSQPSIGNILLGHDRTYVDGQLIVPKSLTTTAVRSGNEFLHFLGHSNIAIKVLKSHDELGASMDFGKDPGDVQVTANNVAFMNSAKESFMRLESGKNGERSIFLNAEKLHIKGKAKSTTSIQTQGILASEDAKISSPTKSVNVSAADRLTLRSFGGNIQADALNNITMSASQMNIHAKVFIPKVVPEIPE